MSYVLLDAEQIAREHPNTLVVPTPEDLLRLRNGACVELAVESVPPARRICERVVVEIELMRDTPLVFAGRLRKDSVAIPDLKHGTSMTFRPRHVLKIETFGRG